MSLSARRGATQREKKWDREGGRDTMEMEFYILNHVLYLIISPSADKGLGGALKGKTNQRQPLWRVAMIPSQQSFGEAQPPGRGRGWMCRMLWSLPCCELRAELHPLEALLVRVGTFLTVCIVPEHFCTNYARENLSFLLLPCQESHPHVLGTSFGLFGSLKLS